MLQAERCDLRLSERFVVGVLNGDGPARYLGEVAESTFLRDLISEFSVRSAGSSLLGGMSYLW